MHVVHAKGRPIWLHELLHPRLSHMQKVSGFRRAFLHAVLLTIQCALLPWQAFFPCCNIISCTATAVTPPVNLPIVRPAVSPCGFALRLLFCTHSASPCPIMKHHDDANALLCCAGLVICFAAFNIPQYGGERLAAVAVLLWLFGLAAIPLAYLLSFLFKVRMVLSTSCHRMQICLLRSILKACLSSRLLLMSDRMEGVLAAVCCIQAAEVSPARLPSMQSGRFCDHGASLLEMGACKLSAGPVRRASWPSF